MSVRRERRWWRPGHRPGPRERVRRVGARGPVSQWVTVGGLRMHARASRGGPPPHAPTVVLVHGLGMSSRYMEPLLNELAPHARVVAPDLPGYGRSASPGQRLTLAGMADALAAWMDAVGIGSAVVVGNSLGAQVIAQLGVRHPHRLTRAVLIGPTRDPAAGGQFQHTLRLALDAPLERPALVGVAVRDYLRAGPRLMYRLFGEALRQREESHLRHLTVPTLIVRGRRDPIVTQSWVEEINRLVPTSRVVVIGGAAHALNFSAAPALAREILAFLAEENGPTDDVPTDEVPTDEVPKDDVPTDDVLTYGAPTDDGQKSMSSSPMMWTAASSALADPPSMPAS